MHDAQPGDVLRNTGFEDKFTCPNCLEDHNQSVGEDRPEHIMCSCGARLRLQLESVPEAACYIADPDDGDDE